MQVFISSSSEDLTLHRHLVSQAVHELGWKPVMSGDENGGRRVDAYARTVEEVDLLVLVVGWRKGPTPSPELGGDGLRSYAQWELESATQHGIPAVIFMAGDSWPKQLRETDAETRASIADFRGELERLAILFDHELVSPDLEACFHNQVLHELKRYRHNESTVNKDSTALGLRIRSRPRTPFPEQPYPLLLPYTHPALLAGRDRERNELTDRLLRLRLPVFGFYAASGAGKSSLLSAGLIPHLRDQGHPVAFDRHPHEPGLASRLVGDLLEAPDDGVRRFEVHDEDPHAFVGLLSEAKRLAGKTPVLVLDQFEDLLRSPEHRRCRALVGCLLAAAAQRQSGLGGPPCRWLISYRQEFHGEVVTWLEDVLRDARAEGLAVAETLPHDLSTPYRFHCWALPPLGAPAPGEAGVMGVAVRAFQSVIEAPLALMTPSGEPRYPWYFAGDGAARLARTFAEARVEQPMAPLVPELQVVLSHLVEQAGEPIGAEVLPVHVPEDLGGLIDCALEDHLCRALGAVVPSQSTAIALEVRSRALLVLRELADNSGRRNEGQPAALLARAVGDGGNEVLEQLSTPRTRLVVLERQSEGWCYVLSHDRLAEVIVRMVEDEGRNSSKLAVDVELLALRRFVTLNNELYSSGDTWQSTRLPRGYFRRIASYANILLWRDDSQRWWNACQRQKQRDRRWSAILSVVLGLILVLVIVNVSTWAGRQKKLESLLDQIESGKPDAALAALDHVSSEPDAPLDQAHARLARRENPVDVIENGAGGVAEEVRNSVILTTARLLLPLLEEDPGNLLHVGAVVWALDFFPGRDPRLAEAARSLRSEVLDPLRRRFPPPPLPDAASPDWADVPAGTFLMGTHPDEGWEGQDYADERPQHEVSVSAIRMQVHEVTLAEYRRLVPDHPGDDRFAHQLPVTNVNWYQAYTYAAWLGGRLPTEAEWEYAARSGCPFEYCSRDGTEATLDEVAWYRKNSSDPKTLEVSAQRVMQLEPNPWGLYDMYGNSWEWVADWFGEYPTQPQQDPMGLYSSNWRTLRGGSCYNGAPLQRAGYRLHWLPGDGPGTGFRVVLPASSIHKVRRNSNGGSNHRD